jgi:hypothetical protein
VAKNSAIRRSASPACTGGRLLHRRRCACAAGVNPRYELLGLAVVAGSCCAVCITCSIAGWSASASMDDGVLMRCLARYWVCNVRWRTYRWASGTTRPQTQGSARQMALRPPPRSCQSGHVRLIQINVVPDDMREAAIAFLLPNSPSTSRSAGGIFCVAPIGHARVAAAVKRGPLPWLSPPPRQTYSEHNHGQRHRRGLYLTPATLDHAA